MDLGAVDLLNQSLKTAGIHPSQTDPVVLHERGDIFPHAKWPEPPPPHFHRHSANDKAMMAYQKWLAGQKDGWVLRVRLKLGLIPDFWRHLQ
jgi:hypothetical protein